MHPRRAERAVLRVLRAVARRPAVLGLALAAGAVAGGGSAGAPGRPDTLVIVRSLEDYVTNDVHRMYEYTSQIIDNSAYETLVTVEAPDFTEIRPKLAERWEVSEDGLAYTFHLRRDARFSSGNPVGARDVRFSLRRLKNLRDSPSFLVDPVRDVEVVNDSTVRIVLKAPDASFLAALAAVPCGIADSRALAARGGTDADDAREKDRATGWLNQRSEGSGPYRLVSFTANVEAVLERNPGYRGPKAAFGKVLIKHVPSGATRRAMVERGDADVAHDLDPDVVARIPRGPRIRIVEGLSMHPVYLAINTRADVSRELADRRVRQAISYAIDYDGILEGLARGAGERPPAMIPLGLLGADRAMVRRHDAARARRLLAEAGHPGGVTIRLTYWTAPLVGLPAEPLAARLQADLAAVGIKVTLDPKERSVALSEYRAGKPQLMLASWTPDVLDPGPWVDAFYAGGAAARRVGYQNARVSDLAATAKREQDPRRREALYREITSIVMDDVPFVMLVQPKSYVALNPAIRGYAVHPIWFVSLPSLSR